MKRNWKIFKSKEPKDVSYASRFANHERIQLHLEHICEAWAKYLQLYVQRTGETELFGEPELPWINTERAIVSTLSASIIRRYRKSIVLEELRVPKPRIPVPELGGSQVNIARKATGWGRCDLWVAIETDKIDAAKAEPFNFYLEVKVSPKKSWNIDNLEKHLRRSGLRKIFRDYIKRHPETLTQRSPYGKVRKHDHYIIGMYLMRLDFKKEEISGIKSILKDIYEKTQNIYLGKNANEADRIKKKRRMARYPTVALIHNEDSGKEPGFLAVFTVLGATNKLTT